MADAVRKPRLDGAMGEGTLAFELRAPARLDQLDAELAEAMGWDGSSGLSADGDATTASPGAPVTVWVSRGDVDARTFARVAGGHEANPGWRDATVDPSVGEVRAKVSRGERLDSNEIQVALRHLLGE